LAEHRPLYLGRGRKMRPTRARQTGSGPGPVEKTAKKL
jgi:hypothetical protein